MTISVVIATYNGEKYLREQLDSVLWQTLMPDKIIVSDDGSTDGTWEILEEYQKQYPNLFQLYKNEGKHGAHSNFKHAFQYVTTDVFAPCDQDDIWLPEKLERCIAAMDENTSLVFCQETILQEDKTETMMKHMMPTLRECVFGRVVYGHVMVCKREMLDVFALDTEITFDWGLTLYAAIHKSGKKIDYSGCVWRRHSSTVTSSYEGHEVLISEKIGKWSKFCRTQRMLRSGVHSDVLAKRMESIGSIIRYYAPDKDESKMAFDMSKQSRGSMFEACYIYLRLMMKEQKFKEASLKQKIGMMAYAFCYPAMYWYDYHNLDSL